MMCAKKLALCVCSLINDRDHLVGKNHGNYAGNIPERESKKRESIHKSRIDYRSGFDFRE